MVERHPFGSQAFMPLSPAPFLVVVCPDEGPDGPGQPHAFLTRPGQGVNYHRNVWHAVLTPIGENRRISSSSTAAARATTSRNSSSKSPSKSASLTPRHPRCRASHAGVTRPA
jgi:ureidoglycolate hydrolase